MNNVSNEFGQFMYAITFIKRVWIFIFTIFLKECKHWIQNEATFFPKESERNKEKHDTHTLRMGTIPKVRFYYILFERDIRVLER